MKRDVRAYERKSSTMVAFYWYSFSVVKKLVEVASAGRWCDINASAKQVELEHNKLASTVRFPVAFGSRAGSAFVSLSFTQDVSVRQGGPHETRICS